MLRKTYLKVPNDDYAPDNNIQLGYIWREPRDPGTFIGPLVEIPEDIKINHTYKGSWTIDLGRESHGDLGLFAKIAQLPAQLVARIGWGKTEDGSYKVPTLDTYSFEPTPEYIKDSVASVSAEIIKSGDSLYMITGVKIARGGEGSNTESSNFGVETEASVNQTVANVPVHVGEQFNYTKGSHNNQGFESTADFVFAYRVREIFYKRGIWKTREYNKGAVLGENFSAVRKGEDAEPEVFIEDAEIDDVDFEGDGEKFAFIDDNGEECNFVF